MLIGIAPSVLQAFEFLLKVHAVVETGQHIVRAEVAQVFFGLVPGGDVFQRHQYPLESLLVAGIDRKVEMDVHRLAVQGVLTPSAS